MSDCSLLACGDVDPAGSCMKVPDAYLLSYSTARVLRSRTAVRTAVDNYKQLNRISTRGSRSGSAAIGRIIPLIRREDVINTLAVIIRSAWPAGGPVA